MIGPFIVIVVIALTLGHVWRTRRRSARPLADLDMMMETSRRAAAGLNTPLIEHEP